MAILNAATVSRGVAGALVAAMLAVLPALPAAAAPKAEPAASPTVHLTHDKAAFLAEAPVVSVEGFEEFENNYGWPLQRRKIWVDRVSYHSLSPSPTGWHVWEADFATPTKVLSRYLPTGFETFDVRISLATGRTVPALGFDILVAALDNHFEVVVTDGRGVRSRLTLGQIGADPLFVGLTSRHGIRSVLITQRPELVGGGSSNFSLDEVARGRIG